MVNTKTYDSPAREYMKDMAKRRIMDLLISSPKTFEDIVKLSGFSRGYVNDLRKELAEQGRIIKTVDTNQKEAWVATKRGISIHRNSWTVLADELSKLVENGGSYSRFSDAPWTNFMGAEDTPEGLYSLYAKMDLAEFPSDLANKVNFIKVQYDVKNSVVREVIKELYDKRDSLPASSKVIMSFELDLSTYQKFLRKIGKFIENIKNGANVFTDTELGIDTAQNKIAFLEAYLDNAALVNDVINDKEYTTKLAALSKNKTFLTTLISVANNVDLNTLNKFINTFKSGEDPLDNTSLAKKLVIPIKIDGKIGFIEPFYDYVSISRILNHNDKKLRDKLREYALRNEHDLGASKVNRIVMGIHTRQKDNYKKEKNGVFRCKDCGTGFQTLEQYEMHICIPQKRGT